MTKEAMEISNWESLLYRYFDGEVSDEERKTVEAELEKSDSKASNFLSQLSLIQGEVRKWHHEASLEIEKDYKPGFSYRHIEGSSEGKQEKTSFFGSLLGKQALMLGAGFAAGFAFLVFNLMSLKGGDPELTIAKDVDAGSETSVELDDPQPNRELLAVNRDDSRDKTLPRLDETDRLALQKEGISGAVAQVPVLSAPAGESGQALPAEKLRKRLKVAKSLKGQNGAPLLSGNKQQAKVLSDQALRASELTQAESTMSVEWIKPAQGYTHTLVSPNNGRGAPVIWLSRQSGAR